MRGEPEREGSWAGGRAANPAVQQAGGKAATPHRAKPTSLPHTGPLEASNRTCSTSSSCGPKAALRLRSMPIFMVAALEAQVPQAPCRQCNAAVQTAGAAGSAAQDCDPAAACPRGSKTSPARRGRCTQGWCYPATPTPPTHPPTPPTATHLQLKEHPATLHLHNINVAAVGNQVRPHVIQGCIH